MTEQELTALRREISSVRRDRLDRARKLPGRAVTERAIAEAERDLDALTNDRAEALRAEVEELTGRLRTAWSRADWYRLALLRIESVGIHIDDLAHSAQFNAILEVEKAARATAAAAFAASGLGISVPPVLDVYVPEHPNRAKVAEAIDEARANAAKRAMSRARPTSHREPDRHAR